MSRVLQSLFFLVVLVPALFAADVPQWKQTANVALSGKAEVLEYSPDGKFVALGYADGSIQLVDVMSGAVLRTISTDLKPLDTITFLRRSQRVVVCGGATTVRVLSLPDWNLIREGQGITDCAVSLDETLIVGRSKDEAVWVWNAETVTPERQLIRTGARPRDAGFVLGDKYVSVAIRQAFLVDPKTGERKDIRQVGDKKTQISITQTQGNQAAISLGALQDDDAPTHRAVLSREGSLAAFGRGWAGQPDFVDVWDFSKGQRIARFKYKDGGTISAFSHDNEMIAIAGSNPGTITIFRLTDKKKVEVKGGFLFQFSPAVLQFAAVDNDHMLIYTPNKK